MEWNDEQPNHPFRFHLLCYPWNCSLLMRCFHRGFLVDYQQSLLLSWLLSLLLFLLLLLTQPQQTVKDDKNILTDGDLQNKKKVLLQTFETQILFLTLLCFVALWQGKKINTYLFYKDSQGLLFIGIIRLNIYSWILILSILQFNIQNGQLMMLTKNYDTKIYGPSGWFLGRNSKEGLRLSFSIWCQKYFTIQCHKLYLKGCFGGLTGCI